MMDDGLFVRLSQNLVFLKRYFTILPLPQGPCPNALVSFAITALARYEISRVAMYLALFWKMTNALYF